MSQFHRRSLLGLAVLSAPLLAAVACSSTNTGSAPLGTGTGTTTKDAGSTTGTTGDDDDSGLTGTTGGGDDDSGTGTTGTFDSGPIDDAAASVGLPQAFNSGGAILAAPKFVTITFPSYTYKTQVQAFMSGIGSTTFWTDSTSEYGIASVPSSNVKNVELTTSQANELCTAGGTCTDDTIQAWLKNNWTSSGALGVSDASTIYTIFFPENITISQGAGATSCQQFGGYHDEVDLSNGKKIAYAIIPTCASSAGESLTPLNNVTLGAAHELIEAATDPNPNTNPAWFFPMSGYSAGWALANQAGELSDLCEQDPDAIALEPTTMQAVQRSWSNKAAAAGQDPCVPHITNPNGYFNALAVPPDVQAQVPFQQLEDGGIEYLTNVAVTDVSATAKTIEVKVIQGAGDNNPGSLTLEAIDFAGYEDSQSGSTQYQYLSFAWDNGMQKISAVPGQVVHLTITATAQGTALSSAGQNDSRMGAADYPDLPVIIVSTHTGSDGGIDDGHYGFTTMNLGN